MRAEEANQFLYRNTLFILLLSFLPFIHVPVAVDLNRIPQFIFLAARAAIWLVFLALSWIPAIWCQSFAEFLLAWLHSLLGGAILFMVRQSFQSDGCLRITSVTASVSALGLAGIAIWQYSKIPSAEAGGRALYSVTSTLAHKNLLSGLMMLALPFSLFGPFTEGRWRRLLGASA